MADNIDVNVNVNTSAAQRNLDNLNNRITGISRSFNTLKTAIAGIAFGGLIANNLRFAASMVDVSTSTDIALEAVVGFSRAVQDNGGSLEGAQNALQKFNVTIGEAAEGSASAQDAFRKVGVTLDDLRTLSQEDLLRKTILGLNQISDASLRAKLQTELLGKAFRGVDIKGLAVDYDDAIRSSAKYVTGIKSADETQRKLEKSLTDLRLVLLDIIEPIANIANKIDVTSESFAKLVKGIQYAAAALAVVFVGGRILGGVLSLVSAVRALDLGLKGIAKIPIKDIFKGIFSTEAAKKNLQKLQDLRDYIVKQWTGRVGPEAAAERGAEKFGKFSGKLDEAYNSAKKLLGTIASIVGIGSAFTLGAAQKPKFDARDFGAKEATEGQIRFPGLAEEEMAKREVIVALQKQIAKVKEVTAEYNRSTAEQIANINIQRLSIDMSRDEIEVMNAVDEVIKRNTDAIKQLQDEKEGLASDSPLIPAIEKEIKILQDSLEQDKRNTAEAVRNLQIRQLEQEKLTKVIEQTNVALSQGASLQALQDQLSLVGQYGQELENNLVRLDVQRELESTLNGLAVRALELEQQRVQLGEQRYQQEMNNLLALTDAAYRYADARLEAEKKILDAQRATQQNAKLGTEQAIADIQKQFEPYQMAQDAVKQGWGRVSDALDTFVETGKLKFGDLARSILADLAKMILKAMVFKAISGIAGAFGLSIPGLAKGGPAKGGQPYIVGEKGPELFIPQGSGTVVPNNKLQGAQNGVATGAVNAPVTNNYNTYNINALDAKSVATLFAENRKAIFGANKMAEREMSYAGAR